jgi:hypothetical protein
MTSSAKSRLLLLPLILLLGLLSTVARGQLISIGAAGDFAGLELGTSTFTISKNSTVVNGNIGVAPDGTLNFSGGAVANGTIYAGTGATLDISGGSGATGGIVQPSSLVTQAISDAATAASFYGGLTPTQTLSSLGAGTITGNGGLQVFDVTGSLSLSNATLTLSGGASDTFVFDIHGGNSLLQGQGPGSNIVLDGISPDQVLFNLIGSGTQLTTNKGSDTEGIFLAENGAIDIQGGTHDSDFIAGTGLTFESGVTITQPGALTPVPELGTWPTAIFSLALMGLMVRLCRKPARA